MIKRLNIKTLFYWGVFVILLSGVLVLAGQAAAFNGAASEDRKHENIKFIDEMTHIQEKTYQQKIYSLSFFSYEEFQTVYQADLPYPVFSTVLAPGGDETQLNFSWYSLKTGMPGVVEYAKVTDGQAEPFVSVTAELAAASFGYSGHEATITGLEPSSTYIYRLGDGKGNWTAAESFQTQDTESFSFLLMGDPQIGSSGDIDADGKGWEETLNTAVAKFPETSFIQSAGDQVSDPTSEKEYAAYTAPEVLKQLPAATTVGNHDNTEYYEFHFNVPNQNPELGNHDNSGGDYYFTYGNTLIINLNSNNNNIEEHEQFTEETLEAVEGQDLKWKLIVLHHSIYSAAAHSTDEYVVELREGLVPIIDELDIDAVLMGHDHSYVRTFQMKGGRALKNQMVQDGKQINPEGTVYITANSSSGSKYYFMEPEPEPYAAVREQLEVPTFTNVEIAANSLAFTTYRADSMEITDSYEIVKDESIETVLPELERVVLDSQGNKLPTEPTSFYPDVELEVKGISTEGGVFDLLPEKITYKSDQEDKISISPDGEISAAPDAAPGTVKVWAEIEVDGEIVQSNEKTLELVEHADETFVQKGSAWSYRYDGTGQGEEWREKDFDDSGWESAPAPLGFPEDEERPEFGTVSTGIEDRDDSGASPPTAYFRHEFEIDELSAIGDIGKLRFGVDDSVILYLNGNEIARFNLPDGEISPEDYVEDLTDEDIADEDEYVEIYLDEEQLSHLREGENILAAEVHQDDAYSSDLYWDMEFMTNLKTE